MGILEFILSTASSVLGSLVTSRFSGKPEFVRKSDLEQLVEQTIRTHQATLEKDHEILPRSAVQEIMNEIDKLAEQLSYVRVLPDQIEVQPPKKSPLGHVPAHSVVAAHRIDELRRAIVRRRNELGIPDSPVGAPVVSPVEEALGHWVPVSRPTPITTSAAERRLNALRERIAQRRDS